ncbi:Crp/Fnr family transcriptional regulator [Piscibacillus salipiscarius]|uniref:Crp/Fnr family transcriptional regulator n=1 Tax=Piscibacillus salipiscarius TaxID=299480 RepID=A0ABW5QBG8_9BACI|nr:Crp/Fnr family transcriptional regulator [Piscibacillus salipiscarius]
MKYDELWYLSKIGFLEHVAPPASNELIGCIKHARYNRNEVIRTPDNTKHELGFIKEGSVRLYTINDEGKQFTCSLLGPGSTFGKMRSFSLHMDNVYVEAIEPTHFCTVDEESFMALANKYPILLHKALETLSDRLKEREERLKVMALDHCKDKVIHLLQMIYDRYNRPSHDQEFYTITLPITQQELANMIGSSRESVSTVLNELAEEGLVKFPKRKQIDVHFSLVQDDPNPKYIQDLYQNY